MYQLLVRLAAPALLAYSLSSGDDMRYALVKDGRVIDVVLWDGVAPWQPPNGYIAIASQAASPGWRLDDDGQLAPEDTGPTTKITLNDLCQKIDAAADRARHKVAGDPLRAEEYKAAAAEAAAFVAANYQGNVPPMVAAWVTPNRTAQQAADDIINEANAYNAALVQLRTTRLQAKEHIRALMAADDVEQAQAVAEHTVAAIEAAVAGIGNNA